MKIKNLVTVKTGSHLYGLATVNSDIDLYTVYKFHNKIYRPSRQIRQAIDAESGEDSVKISLDKYRTHLEKGVPQAIEVLFSDASHWLDYDPSWIDISAELEWLVQDNIGAVLETYRRTIMNFFETDDFKKNRHGFRLLINAWELKRFGHFDPTLTVEQAAEVTRKAELPWSERENLYKDQLWSIFQ